MILLTELENFARLRRDMPAPADHALAVRHAPTIRFDTLEPFLPSVVGYTVLRAAGLSPSFPRMIELPPNVDTVIEYAIWWDWDIQHLYELEHIWIHLDAAGQMVHAEASWHGGWNSMLGVDGGLPLDGGRLILYSEPGKHAFAATIAPLLERCSTTIKACSARAGSAGVLVTPLFKGRIRDRNLLNNRLVHRYLGRRAFVPTYTFDQVFDLSRVPFVPWDNLAAWIPRRVNWWVHALRRDIRSSIRRVLRFAQEHSAEAIQKADDYSA